MSLIPIVDAGVVVDALDTADAGVALVQEEVDAKMVALLASDELERDDPFDTGFAMLRAWQLFRRGDGKYSYCRWHDGEICRNYCGEIVTAKEAATMLYAIGCQPDDELLAALSNAKPLATDDANRMAGNGPQPPDTFRWNGRRATLTPLQFALVDCLCRHDHYTATARNVTRELWPDNEEAESTSLKSLMSETNKRLAKHEVPVSVSRKGAYIRLLTDAQ